MRFSHFLTYNAVPEWQDRYLDYSGLKNLIYTLQSEEVTSSSQNATNVLFNDVEELNAKETEGTQPESNFASKIKDKLFGSSKLGLSDLKKRDFNGNMEGTLELDDLQFDDTENNSNEDIAKINKHDRYSLKNLKPKIFESSNSTAASIETNHTNSNPYDTFLDALIKERGKIDDFYKLTEAKFYERFDTLKTDLELEHMIISRHGTARFEDPNSITFNSADLTKNQRDMDVRNRIDFSEEDLDDYEEDEEIEDNIGQEENTALLNSTQVSPKFQKKSIFKQSITYLFIDLCQLKSFIEINKIGFTKITKKFDKVLHMSMRPDLIDSTVFFQNIYTFQDSTLDLLNQKIESLIHFFALITNQNDNLEECTRELRSLLHDHIVWERSKTWKIMLGLASKDDAIEIDKNLTKDDSEKKEKMDVPMYTKQLKKTFEWRFIRIDRVSIPRFFFTKKALKLAFIITLTGILLGIKTFNDRIEGRCMALVECVAFLWASEAIPLHMTAFLVPLLTVLFKVLKNDDGTAMNGADASSVILASMWSSTIMILLAGFTLSEALSQYDVAKILASWLLSVAGTRPRNVLLMAMGVVFFLSMWISNVASPVLTYSLLTPLLDPLDADTPFAKALVMGVALAADVGGMASPISSPQNIISMEYLTPYGIGWGQFFAVALPCGILATLCSWGIMCVSFNINETKIEKFTPIKTKLTLKQWYVVFVTVGTILLWCVESKIEGVFGSSGQIAVLPIVLLFATGMLSTKDLNSFPWSIVILAMGGIALGKAVSSSGLLTTIAKSLQARIANYGLLSVLCIFGILMLVVGTFVSHTVSAIIIVPLVQEIGEKLDNPKAAPVLVFGCALLASCGMGLASSGFPNVTAISMADKNGKRYLNVMSFLTRGVPASFLAWICIVTLGYGIMISVVKDVSN